MILNDLLVRRAGNELREVVIVADDTPYRMMGDGFFRLRELPRELDSNLPDEYRGKEIAELRCDGESTAIKLVDGSYVTRSWLLDTRTEAGYLNLSFRANRDVDDDFLEFYDVLDPCGVEG